MAKGTVVRGTPVNHIGPGGSATGDPQGHNPATLKGYSGTTTSDQFRGDQSNRVDARSGTPANSQRGNPDETRNVRQAGRYGVSPGAGGQDYNSHTANGNGVVFDGVARSRDLMPPPAAAMDSPVSQGAQRPDTDSVAKLNALRNGKGDAYPAEKTIPDALVGTGGTMDR
jgi:hypothetical protein